MFRARIQVHAQPTAEYRYDFGDGWEHSVGAGQKYYREVRENAIRVGQTSVTCCTALEE